MTLIILLWNKKYIALVIDLRWDYNSMYTIRRQPNASGCVSSESMISTIVISILIGLLTGTVTAITAGSGVALVVPLLTIFLGYSIHEAIGTSLLVDVIASIAVTISYYHHDRVDLKAGALLAIGAVLGAQIGSQFANVIPQHGLQGSFSIFIILAGLSLIYRAFSKRSIDLRFLRFKNRTLHIISTLLIGLIIGTITGLFGAGGGGTILLVLVYIMDYPFHLAIGTATAIMAITAASGVVGYASQGQIPWVESVLIGLAAVASGALFSKIANRSSEKSLYLGAACIFITIGIVMFFIEGGTEGVINSLHLVMP